MNGSGDTVPRSLPLIVGHRGSSSVAPENTLAGFEQALRDGADGVEFDVRLARDGVPVVIHDATLKRTSLREAGVAALSSAELKECDVGTWFNLRFPGLAQECFTRQRVPTLAEVFELFGSRFEVLYVEMKCEELAAYAPLARAVVEAIREHSLGARAVVKSFEHEALREVKRVAPEIRTAALFDRKWSRPHIPAAGIIADTLACGADEVSLHRTLLRRAVVDEAGGRGLRTVVWTVDSPAWLRRNWRLGLRAVITNMPSLMRAALEELRAGLTRRGR